MRSRSSSAAARPISGLAPAPRPLVISPPIAARFLRCHILQRLGVGVGADEIHALHLHVVNHVLDGVTATAANTDHLDDRILRYTIDQFKHLTLLFRMSILSYSYQKFTP